jgi:GT2 family glycosyltransferase
MYSEEIDWCWRMWRAGWEVWYTPDARVIHYGGQSTRQVREEMVKALYRSKVRFFRAHRGRGAAMCLTGLLVVITRLRWTIRRLFGLSPAGITLRPRDLKAVD